ncbi:MAG: carboxypeptidase-like regulatory domain-containing protein [Chlorobi bacterium]|nr:carboxypeptidase-like regulatory domain-containing protein [Chlorobiota bacterium]
MLNHRLFLLLLLILPLGVVSQNIVITGVVKDKQTKQPLAFVNILSKSGKGTISDIDGKFTLRLRKKECCLNFSSVGYETLDYTIDYDKKYYKVFLTPKSYELQEVEIRPGINPAHRIIDSVLANRNRNDPEKLKSFRYISYDKMIVTVDTNSIRQIDTTEVSRMDSLARKGRAFLKKSDLFIMETVTERKFKFPGLNQETVLATKVSGFKDPMMAFMISQVQSTSFYDELIKIAGKSYVNPISRGSKKKYYFQIEDTLYDARKDTIFIISFRPFLKTNFNGMKGFLSINSYKWAIQNVKATPARDTTGIIIKIEQAYDLVDDHWFPVQLHTDIIFKNAQFGAGGYKINLVGNGRSYIKDIEINPDLKNRNFGYSEVEIEPGAAHKKAEFWKEYRVDSLSAREVETYRVIDSIGKASNFDKMANTFQTLLTGRIPVGFINIDLNQILRFNNYEGIYLGLGIHTNERLSKVFSIGGYGGYAFGAKRFNYGADLNILLHKRSQSRLRIDGYNTVISSGYVEFWDDKYQLWNPSNFYKFFINQMNNTIGGEINYTFKFRALRHFTWDVGYVYQQKETFRDYYFTTSENPEKQQTLFTFSNFSVGFRFAFKERTIETTKGRFSMGTDYPVVYFNYTRGVKGFLDGDYAFNRFDLKIEHKIKFKYLGQLNYRIMAGYITGEVPVSNLYNGIGTYSIVTLYSPYSFGTMRPNEFYSDRYVSFFITQNFGNILINLPKWHPELLLVTNIGFGDMKNKENHHGLSFNTMEKGYYESGIMFRKLYDFRIYDIGAGVLYRYGPYSFDNQSLNFSYKIGIFFSF